MRRRTRRLRLAALGLYRTQVEAALIVAVCLAFAANVQIFRTHHQTPWSLAKGVWKYGPIGLFVDPPLEPIRLSDPATFHMSCGPGCEAKGVGR